MVKRVFTFAYLRFKFRLPHLYYKTIWWRSFCLGSLHGSIFPFFFCQTHSMMFTSKTSNRKRSGSESKGKRKGRGKQNHKSTTMLKHLINNVFRCTSWKMHMEMLYSFHRIALNILSRFDIKTKDTISEIPCKTKLLKYYKEIRSSAKKLISLGVSRRVYFLVRLEIPIIRLMVNHRILRLVITCTLEPHFATGNFNLCFY